MENEPLDTRVENFRQQILALMEQEMQGNPGASTDLQSVQASLSAMLESLQVTSEELSQQNEQLSGMKDMLEQERQRYARLFEAAPDAYLVTDRRGVIREDNQAAARMLNYRPERLSGKPLAAFFRGKALRDFLRYLHQMDTDGSGQRQEWETQLQPRRKPQIDVLISAAVDTDHQRFERNLLWLVRDITQQKQQAREIYESQARLRVIFETAPVGILLLGVDGSLIEYNPSFLHIFGYKAEDLSTIGYIDIIARGTPWEEPLLFHALSTGSRNGYIIEQFLPRKNGQNIWVKTSMSLLRDAAGKPQSILGLFEDITDLRKRNDEVLELEHNLEDAREKEREKLARDLHDGPLQLTLGILFKLQQFSELGQGEQEQEIQETISLVRQVVTTLRSTTGMLRSPILAHFGLNRAIHAHVRQVMEEQPHLNLAFQEMPMEKPLPPRVQQGLFTIFQHAVANVIRHSQAHFVIIRLLEDNRRVVLEIEDDGTGFDVPEHWNDLIDGAHYGLVGSAERAAQLGGELRIRSTLGGGTSVRVEVPLNEDEQKKHSRDDLGPEIPQFE